MCPGNDASFICSRMLASCAAHNESDEATLKAAKILGRDYSSIQKFDEFETKNFMCSMQSAGMPATYVFPPSGNYYSFTTTRHPI